MRTSTKILIATLAAAPPCYASAGNPEANGLLMTLFFGFAGLIVAFQLVPALMLFSAMLKGLFSALGAPAAGKAEGKRS